MTETRNYGVTQPEYLDVMRRNQKHVNNRHLIGCNCSAATAPVLEHPLLQSDFGYASLANLHYQYRWRGESQRLVLNTFTIDTHSALFQHAQ